MMTDMLMNAATVLGAVTVALTVAGVVSRNTATVCVAMACGFGFVAATVVLMQSAGVL